MIKKNPKISCEKLIEEAHQLWVQLDIHKREQYIKTFEKDMQKYEIEIKNLFAIK